ncbi:unnamed protein product [Blepharisma stoltei]|uniref:Uncharacterized protein n=1 Tax=Blepharisma stoltei TaxID=1481888 RepID=A0AAU9K1I7_9CILI|nr:unnamed protein product [Blepharisma stoltei]
MTDLYLEEQRLKVEEFTKMLSTLYVNDLNHQRQLQAEFNTLSALPENMEDMSNIYKKEYHRIQSSICLDFIKQCKITQLLLNKIIFEIHKQNTYNSYNLNFRYLYNFDENLNGTEIYIYDLKSHKRTSTCELKSYKSKRRLCDKVTNYAKISNSHLLIMGADRNLHKGILMDLKTKTATGVFNFSTQERVFDVFNQFIYYDNYLFIFGDAEKSGLLKYNINRNKWHQLAFPCLKEWISSVLYRNYVLISSSYNSIFYLYDLLIEAHSEIAFYEHVKNRKFLFTDQVRAYLWVQNGSIYESDENNPFKWNKIGNNDFGIRDLPLDINLHNFDITFSNYEGDIYASLIIRPQMYCYKFNKKRKAMKIIYQGEVNR